MADRGAPRRVSNEEILESMWERLKASDKPFLTTSEIASGVVIQERHLPKRLFEIVDEGLVGNYQSGDRSPHLWWITEEGRAHLEDADDGQEENASP